MAQATWSLISVCCIRILFVRENAEKTKRFVAIVFIIGGISIFFLGGFAPSPPGYANDEVGS